MENIFNKKINTELTGEGGGGKGGGSSHVATEAPNTLTNSTIVRVLELLSEGPITGLVTGDGQSIFFNGTPIQNSDASYNFDKIAYGVRTGLASQPYMNGFPSASATVVVNTAFTVAASVVKTTSSSTVDAVKVVVGLPQGLSNQNTTNGDLNGSTVEFAIDRKPTSSGTWELNVLTPTISGKCVSAYERSYYVTKPSGATGTWDIRCRRITADNVSSAIKNATSFDSLVEIQEVQLPYNNSAYVGIAIDAQSVGNTVPVRSYLLSGIICQVPSNYNPATGVYSGIWNGTFITGTTDNPAWILYDILTNTRYGMGRYGMTASQIDKFSFYNAGVYCDGLVNNGAGGTERRFTFNAAIAASDSMLKILQNVAGMMNSVLIYSGGLITVNQDRPSSAVKLISKSNVIDGAFTYAGSALPSRTTSANVTYNNKADKRYLPVVSTTTDAAGVARYGFNPVDFAAYGATTEGQAIRAAKWLLYTNLNLTEKVSFSMGLNGFDLAIGNVFKLFDEDYTTQAGAGKIVSATSTTVTFDQPVVISGSASVDIVLPDGKTIESHPITTSAGTYSTVSISGSWSIIPVKYADYIVTSAIAPRLFRITSLSQDESTPHQVKVEAMAYVAGKYDYVESGISIPATVYSSISGSVIGDPTALAFQPIGVSDASGVRQGILITWTKPTLGIPVRYTLKWRRNSGDYVTVENIGPTEYEIVNAYAGTYDVVVSAININGQSSRGTSASYTLDLSAGFGSALNNVTGLTVVGGGTAFSGVDLNIQWTNPSSNSNITTVLKDFQVEVYNGAALVRTEYVGAGTQPGAVATYQYTYTKNVADGGPNRLPIIKVYARDTGNKVTSGVQVTFNNPTPAVPGSIAVTGGIGSVFTTFTKPTDSDYKGVLVWMSTTNAFTPSAANLVFDGDSSVVSSKMITTGVPHYVVVSAYDSFGKSSAGTGMTLSSQFAVTPTASAGIPNGAALPGSGTEGDLFFLTTTGKIYRYHTGAWTLAVDGADIMANSITAGKILASTISSNEIAANTIVAGNIAANTITASQIAAGTITSNEIAAGTITAADIAAGTITATQLAAGSVTATQIAAGAITAGSLGVTSLSAITANIGTLRTATSGARMEIKDNVIKVYDASGVLRVQLGDLTL